MRHPTDSFPLIRSLGEDGLLVEFAPVLTDAANAAALAFRAAMEADRPAGVVETSTALKSAYLRFNPLDLSHDRAKAWISALLDSRDWLTASLPSGRRRWRMQAAFGGEHGPRLEEVADAAGLTPDAAVDQVAQTSLRVLAMGFAPGMPYLGLLPAAWDIPRQSTLTPSVPEGALVVAVRQVVVFSVSAQTGWRQIGRAAFRAFDPCREPPFLLTPGDEICFEPVSSTILTELLNGERHLPAPETIE